MPEVKKADDVLVEVEAASICGTDVHVLGDPPGFIGTKGIILGHECVGTVKQVGTGVEGFKAGDRVVLVPNLPCGYCESCRRGKANMCNNERVMGVTCDGVFARYFVAPEVALTKIPDALNGWSVYCHLYSNAYKMDTDPVVITLPGMEPPAESEGEGKDSEGGEEAKSGKTEETAEKKASDEEGGEDEEDEGATEEPKEFTVSASGNILYKADSMGNPDGDAVSSLTFTGSGNVVVKSEDPFKSWTVNGVRFEPEEEISSFKMLNLSSDTSISLKVAAKTAASAKVDESNMLTVTCKGCTFTYLRGGLKKVASGKVPSGAVIYVFADSFDAAANGYVVNGGEAQSQGAASMQVTVTEDTEIVVK